MGRGRVKTGTYEGKFVLELLGVPASWGFGSPSAFCAPHAALYGGLVVTKTGSGHSRTSKGALDDTQGSKSAEQAKTAPKKPPRDDHSAL